MQRKLKNETVKQKKQHSDVILRRDKKKIEKVHKYLGIKTHCILGGFVEFWVFQHVFFPTGALKYSQSERRQSSEELHRRKNKTKT